VGVLSRELAGFVHCKYATVDEQKEQAALIKEAERHYERKDMVFVGEEALGLERMAPDTESVLLIWEGIWNGSD